MRDLTDPAVGILTVMPKKYEHINNEILEKVSQKNVTFDWIFYEEVRFWKARYTNCTWNHCKFYRTLFSHKTVFTKCRFEQCRFWGQHTYLGGPARYVDCEFIDCSFKNVQMWQAEFIHCKFTGLFENLVFYGPEAPKGWVTVLKDVDLSAVQMKDTDFRTGIDLSTTILPIKA